MGSATEQSEIGSNAPDLRPPGTRFDASAGAASTKTGYRWVWFALAGMVILSLTVIFVLPQLVLEHEENKQQDMATLQGPASSAAVADSTASRTEAEQALRDFLHLRAKLELANADAWGEPAWSQSAEAANAGDRLFGERRFGEAAQTYTTAVRTLEELDNSRGEHLATALEAGWRALESDDADTAKAQFELALMIEPDHAPAQQGLVRARARGDVIDRMEVGKRAESEGDLEAARAAYAQAIQLDSEYQAAGRGFERVSHQLTDIAFNDAMNRALAALDAGRLSAAGRALEEAAQLKPRESVVQDTRARLVKTRQQVQLNELRSEAFAKIETEDWQAVIDLYQKAINVDANAGFARDGLPHARDRIRLHQQFDHYLTDPSRLFSPEPLANAEQLLSVASQAPDNEPRLAEKIAALKKHVSHARTPVPVKLHSDGLTNVIIYHVGRLGQFQSHHLELRPGSYTAVGSRPGYRDVRRVFSVQPGVSPKPLEIRCEEPI